MSSSSTPVPSSGYASPAPLSTTPAPPKPNNAAPKPKPVNVFSNDGSFLERFQRLKKEEDEKKKTEDTIAKYVPFPIPPPPSPSSTHILTSPSSAHILTSYSFLCRKREFDNRFKKRGKRPSPDSSSSTPATENPAKKAKVEEPLSEFQSSRYVTHIVRGIERAQAQYQKELQNYADRA
ncbi:hypothetical protein LXA43DRAFT_976145 [Ganoderma leucocontextum]|nr:hypothetical protein LXA43DRAFT_976145 [Ganoderma leucocontextum]